MTQPEKVLGVWVRCQNFQGRWSFSHNSNSFPHTPSERDYTSTGQASIWLFSELSHESGSPAREVGTVVGRSNLRV